MNDLNFKYWCHSVSIYFFKHFTTIILALKLLPIKILKESNVVGLPFSKSIIKTVIPLLFVFKCVILCGFFYICLISVYKCASYLRKL